MPEPNFFALFLFNFVNKDTYFNKLTSLLAQGVAAISYDAVQVIHQALSTEPCLSLNGSNIRQAGRELMFNCMLKVID